MHPNQVVWQPYEAELGHLLAFCFIGREMWTTRVLLVCFWLVEKYLLNCVVCQFGMVQEIPFNVDIDNALHAIDLRGKTKVNWREKHVDHIQVWNSRAKLLCHGVRLEGDMPPDHPYFQWYNRVTWRFFDHTSAALRIMIASHKQLLMRYVVGSHNYKQIIDVLKAVDHFHYISAHILVQNTEANLEVSEDIGRPSTSSTPTSHSHSRRAALHQVITRLDPFHPHMHLLPQISLHPYMHLLSQRSFHPLLMHLLTPRSFHPPNVHFLTPLIFHLLRHPLISALISMRPLLSCTPNPSRTALVI